MSIPNDHSPVLDEEVALKTLHQLCSTVLEEALGQCWYQQDVTLGSTVTVMQLLCARGSAVLEEVTGRADVMGKRWNRRPSPRTAAWQQNKGQPLVLSTSGNLVHVPTLPSLAVVLVCHLLLPSLASLTHLFQR